MSQLVKSFAILESAHPLLLYDFANDFVWCRLNIKFVNGLRERGLPLGNWRCVSDLAPLLAYHEASRIANF
jgi:hypothetical protein